MTTPRVDIKLEFSPEPAFTFILHPDGTTTTVDQGSYNTSERHDLRPESTSHPKDSQGFRYPGSWYHMRNDGTLRTGGSLRARYIPTGDIYQRFTPDNTFGIDSMGLPNPVPQALFDRATTKMYLKLKDSNTNLAVALAEARETGNTIVDSATKIAKSVNAFRRKSPKLWGQVVRHGARNEWRNVPQEWLQLQYGWNPLMSDVYGSAKELQKSSTGKPNIKRVVGSAKDVFNVSDRSYYGVFTSNSHWQDIVQRHEKSVRCICIWELQNPLLATLSSVGVTNPLELVWERVPYSFVVDWFLPIGNWLSTFDANLGWNFKCGCYATFERMKVLGQPMARSSPDGNWDMFENFCNPIRNEWFRNIRTPIGEPPGVGLPRFKNPLSGIHIANALSLLTNAFR